MEKIYNDEQSSTFEDVLEVFINYENKINSKDIEKNRIPYLEFAMDAYGFFLDFCEAAKTDDRINVDKSVEREPDPQKVTEFINYSYLRLYRDSGLIENEFKSLESMTDEELFEKVKDYSNQHALNMSAIKTDSN